MEFRLHWIFVLSSFSVILEMHNGEMAIESVNHWETSSFFSLKLLEGCALIIIDCDISILQVAESSDFRENSL